MITAHSGCEGTPDNSMESILKGHELLHESGYLTEEEFAGIYADNEEIIRLLVSITKKQKMQQYLFRNSSFRNSNYRKGFL